MKDIQIVNFKENEYCVILPLIYDLIKDNRKKYTELQLKRGIGHWYEFINLKLLYKETEKTIIVTKKY
jgi:hypothetical protein